LHEEDIDMFKEKKRFVCDFGHKMYTDEEENTSAINYLKNRAADRDLLQRWCLRAIKKGKPVIIRARSGNP
jgi:uncharacterized membrane-anchored protein YjiN (DUF445 family)